MHPLLIEDRNVEPRETPVNYNTPVFLHLWWDYYLADRLQTSTSVWG